MTDIDKNSTKKVGHLLKNTGILAIGEFSSKILVFFLVPLYTAVLTTGEYGSYDIIYSTVTLLIPLLTLNVAGALLRFPMEKDADVPRIARIGLMLILLSSVVVLLVQLTSTSLWTSVDGLVWLTPLYASTALYQSLTFLARGLERMGDIAVAGISSAVILVALNVGLLLFAQWGLAGYFIANIASMLLPSLWLLLRMRKVFFASSRGNDASLFLRMVRYSVPLSVAIIGWWLIGMSDRYIVLALCGMDANGLYSVAYRIPSILTTIANIFIQAWQVSAVKEFHPKDPDGFLRNTFAAVETVVIVLCSVMIPLSPFIGAIMFSGEFYAAWKYVPLLLVYAALNAMSGMWGPFFSASYDSKIMATSTFFAGAANVALGIPFVALFGVQGACFSSVIAGFASWGLRARRVKDCIEVGFGARRSFALYAALTAQALVMCFGFPTFIVAVTEALFFAGFVFVCRRQIVQAIRLFKKVLHGRKPGN